jgi:hypothetical protein
MDRVDTDGHIIVDGKRQFYDGDPQSQPEKPATVLKAEFLNSVQEEICRAIESQGIDLSEGDYSQLTEAIKKAAYYPFNVVCSNPDDLQKFLKANSDQDNLSIRVDVDQDITEPIVFTGKNLCIAGTKWGITIFNKIPQQEFSGSFISIINDGFKISDLHLDKFKTIVTFSRRNQEQLKGSVISNCFLFTNHEDGDLHGGDENITNTIFSASSFAVQSYTQETT